MAQSFYEGGHRTPMQSNRDALKRTQVQLPAFFSDVSCKFMTGCHAHCYKIIYSFIFIFIVADPHLNTCLTCRDHEDMSCQMFDYIRDEVRVGSLHIAVMQVSLCNRMSV